MKKIVNISFTGFWNNFDYKTFLPFQLLSQHYDVRLSDSPDILFCSIFDGYSFCKYDCIRVFCTSECYYPDMNLFDYAISITNIKAGDRVFQLPYFMYVSDINELSKRRIITRAEIASKKKFCNFVYLHSSEVRDNVFRLLSTYKKVDSAGRYMNNMDGFTPGDRTKVTGISNTPKIQFQSQYKFSIACENYQYEDYVTEKLIHAYMARTVPIYWGDPNVCNIFNPKSFINVSDFSSDEELLDKIKEIDNDENLFLSILNEPVFKDSNYVSQKIEKLDVFICSIADNKDVIRRPLNYNANELNNWMVSMDAERHDVFLKYYRILKRKLL